MARTATDSDGWNTVSETEVDESKIVFDTIGDVFIGTYLGNRKLSNSDGSYIQARFRNPDGAHFFTNANYSLQNGLDNVKVGQLCRITFESEKDTGQRSPMRVFRVDVKR